MAVKTLNDTRLTVMAANFILKNVPSLLTVQNGTPLSPEQEDNNDNAELLIEYANAMRERCGKTPIAVQPAANTNAQATDQWGA